MRLSIHTHCGSPSGTATCTWDTRENDARSSVGPRPGHGAWDEVPRRPVIEPVIAIAIGIVIGIAMVIVIVIVIVIRPVARKRKARIETPRWPPRRLLPE